MKLYRNIIFFLIATLWTGLFIGCSEDNTLDGATEVYITLNSRNITLRVGDTIRISAKVTNLSGDPIETPVKWSVLDENVATILGDTAIVCVKGAQGKETKLKAELINGKYALASVTVTTNLPKGITPVDESGAIISAKRSYNIIHDSILFAISPKELLEDFIPEYTIEGVEPFGTPITIDKEKGLVAVHYSAPRAAGEGKITVSIGDASVESASCTILLMPRVLATFYGAKYADLPYLGTRPDKSVLPQWFAYTNETDMDINTETTVRVAMNTETGAREDIEAAYTSYRWEVVSGSSVVVSEMYEDFVEGQGFDAVLTVRSGIEEGTTEFHCITPDTILVATFIVQNYKVRYPVEKIIVSDSDISIPVGSLLTISTSVEPATSYAYHKPVVTAADPSMVEVGKYDGNMITLKGLKVGTTKLILTSNSKRLEVPVTITEAVKSVTWKKGNNYTLFSGQSIKWGVEVAMVSGGINPYDVTWISSDESVIKAAQTVGDRTTGIVTGVAPGKATIRAKVQDIQSDPASVNVISLPSDQMYSSDNTVFDNTVVYPEGNDLVVIIAPKSIYENITITIAGGYKGTANYDGTYSATSYPITVDINGAKAAATSGSLTIATDNKGYALISCDLIITVGNKSFTIKANNVLGAQ